MSLCPSFLQMLTVPTLVTALNDVTTSHQLSTGHTLNSPADDRCLATDARLRRLRYVDNRMLSSVRFAATYGNKAFCAARP